MRESVTYQAILDEGREEGREVGMQIRQREIAVNLLREGVAIELIAKVSGLSIADLTQLRHEPGL